MEFSNLKKKKRQNKTKNYKKPNQNHPTKQEEVSFFCSEFFPTDSNQNLAKDDNILTFDKTE